VGKHIVRTFARVFPSYHPRAGEQTHFVEKVWKSIGVRATDHFDVPDISLHTFFDCEPKHHTIRAGHHFKVGDFLVPRVWSGKPYRSKQIQIAPPIEIVKTWDFDISGTDWFLDGRHEYALTGEGFDSSMVARNDGLMPSDFYDWFTMSAEFKIENEFHGQVICWNKDVEYSELLKAGEVKNGS
jgi:hypothetical protein